MKVITTSANKTFFYMGLLYILHMQLILQDRQNSV